MGGVCFSKLTLSLFSTSEQRTHWHAFAWHFVYLPQVNWHLVCLRQITSARTSTHPRRPRDLYRLGRGRQRDLCHRGRGRGTRDAVRVAYAARGLGHHLGHGGRDLGHDVGPGEDGTREGDLGRNFGLRANGLGRGLGRRVSDLGRLAPGLDPQSKKRDTWPASPTRGGRRRPSPAERRPRARALPRGGGNRRLRLRTRRARGRRGRSWAGWATPRPSARATIARRRSAPGIPARARRTYQNGFFPRCLVECCIAQRSRNKAKCEMRGRDGPVPERGCPGSFDTLLVSRQG